MTEPAQNTEALRWGNAPPSERTTKYHWQDELRELTMQLRQRFPEELETVRPGQIGFLVNMVDKPRIDGRSRLAVCRRLPAYAEFLTGLRNVVELFRENCKHLTGNQMTLVLYHELRHIAAEGKLQKHDTEEFGEILVTFGRRPYKPMEEGRDIDDILLPEFSWSGIRQATLFDEQTGEIHDDEDIEAHHDWLEDEAPTVEDPSFPDDEEHVQPPPGER